ncbi:MAG: RNA-binding protein [Spirochaetaceae bacterium]|nr:RNA-binding protein [Spirochaetaceae bacterium]
MNARLFLGNLNFNTTNDELLSYLQQSGKILKCEIITDRFTFKSRGFAHIEVEDNETADKIIHELNGRTFHSRPLRIEYFTEN